MDTKRFDQEIGDLAASLGDTTRRGIYISVRESAEPVTASHIAELFDIHPNVARHHLDRLVADGYLRVTHRRRSGKSGPGAGRPAKHYEPTAKAVSVEFPARRIDLLAELLVRAVERAAPHDAAAIAEQVGHEYGSELAAEIGLPTDTGYEVAVRAVAQAMTGVGFGTQAEPEDRRLITRFCPFGETATNHPEVVCRLDQGIIAGLLETTNREMIPVVVPHGAEDEACLITVNRPV